MTAIALGYSAQGRTAQPVPLYVGGDAAAARAAFENPPAGIVRTELILHPLINRRRFFDPAPAPAPAPAEPAAAPAEPPPAEESPSESPPAAPAAPRGSGKRREE